MAGSLKFVGEVRDGLLVSASMLYVIGYLVWSYQALRNKLGLLPALDAQYFVAGLAPSVVMLAGYGLAVYLKRFFIYWQGLVGIQATGGARFLRLLFLWAFWSFLILLSLGPVGGLAILLMVALVWVLTRWLRPGAHEAMREFRFEKAYDSVIGIVRGMRGSLKSQKTRQSTRTDQALALGLILTGVLALFYLQAHRDALTVRVFSSHADSTYPIISLGLIVALTLLPPSDDKYLRFMSKAYRSFWIYIAVPLVIVAAVAFYLTRVYPNLPQEFGGVEPRCAYLDVVRAKMSPDTLRDIVSEDQAAGNQPVVRSARVEVLFSGSSAMFVRSRLGVHEIAKDAIEAVSECD